MDSLKPIAYIHNQFTAKFGIPRQSNIVTQLPSTIRFEREYRNMDAFRGLELFSHIWLIWGFSEAEREGWSATVRPPKLGGNTRVGVFATRSPYRPNAIGLSSVRLHRIEEHAMDGPILHVLGADLMDGTPIYDIKPYLRFTDSHPDASMGFTDDPSAQRRQVVFEEAAKDAIPSEQLFLLEELLANDPRPSYHNDGRVYGMAFGQLEVKFSADGDVIRVHRIIPQEIPSID